MSFTPWTARAEETRSPRGYIRTNWSQDPFSFGAYSFVAKGSGRRHIRRLERPVDSKLFFAGEATFPDRNSTVHSAHESGLRAASEVLKTSAKRIGIIGAGMSGLTAAHKLTAMGKEVTVLEARDRIGGRIWTTDGFGFPVDIGASWIHGVVDNPLTKLSDELGLERVHTTDEYAIRGRGGRIVPDREAPDWLNDVAGGQHRAGADTDQINSWAYWSVEDYDGHDVIFPRGYREIFAALEGDYALKLETTVLKVSTSGSVLIETANGPEQSFDAVIVTVPLGVLKADLIRFDPPLPEDKQDAIRRLGFGVLDKLYLLYDEPFWDLDATWILTPENDQPPGHFNQWLNFAKYIDQPVIMAFNGGSPAWHLAELEDEEFVSRAVKTLDMAYP